MACAASEEADSGSSGVGGVAWACSGNLAGAAVAGPDGARGAGVESSGPGDALGDEAVEFDWAGVSASDEGAEGLAVTGAGMADGGGGRFATT